MNQIYKHIHTSKDFYPLIPYHMTTTMFSCFTSLDEYLKMSFCHTYKPQLVEQVRETCYGPYFVMPGGVPNTNIFHNVPRLPNSSATYWGGQSIWTIYTSHNSHTHTRNTRKPKPQLKSSSCSSAIPSHNSRDVILSHNSMNATCLSPIASHNSRDTFWATIEETSNNPTFNDVIPIRLIALGQRLGPFLLISFNFFYFN